MDEIKHREQVDLIREVFYYQSRFDGKTIVLKIDYPILNAPHFPQLPEGSGNVASHWHRNHYRARRSRVD
jgi:hypothetical protein